MQMYNRLSMARNTGKRYTEYLIYLFFWGVLLMSPFLGAMLKDRSFMPTTGELFAFWGFLAPAIVLFFVNNNILMPFLLYKKKGRLVVLYLLCITIACTIIFISFPVENPHGDGRLRWHTEHVVSSLAAENCDAADSVGDAVFNPPQHRDVWMFFTHPKNVRLILILFVLLFNICVRLFFFTIRRDENIMELEKEKIKSELEYLKYQINPHFFMNSLNNIHALIDIDRGKAQGAVQQLSGMMRYVLYDKSSMFVPLEKEVKFLSDYIDLMRLRYTDMLDIKVEFPSESQGFFVPSMLFMQFVENAFKHGVTYKKKSVIKVAIQVDEMSDTLMFTCCNTVPDGNSGQSGLQGGIGVENARKRLRLFFGEKAVLHVANENGWYNVELKIPVQYDKVLDN